MDLQTFSALTRNGMFEHLSAEAKKLGREDLAKGKSRARKEVLVAAYTELLAMLPAAVALPAAPEPVAYPETPETIIEPELPEIEASYDPGRSVYEGGGHALVAPDTSGSVTPDTVATFVENVYHAPDPTPVRLSVPGATKLVTATLTDGHGSRRLPHGASTAAEVTRARRAKRARNRLKHRKALARKRNGWANGIGAAA